MIYIINITIFNSYFQIFYQIKNITIKINIYEASSIFKIKEDKLLIVFSFETKKRHLASFASQNEKK